MNTLTLRHAHTVPAILANAGENAATKFLEFFAARIRNLNTREAYARACAQFLAWSGAGPLPLRGLQPMPMRVWGASGRRSVADRRGFLTWRCKA
jgi:integrase/recombinase XerD